MRKFMPPYLHWTSIFLCVLLWGVGIGTLVNPNNPIAFENLAVLSRENFFIHFTKNPNL